MDEEQQRERADLLSRLFAMITMKLEDAAGIAAECQGRRPSKNCGTGQISSMCSSPRWELCSPAQPRFL